MTSAAELPIATYIVVKTRTIEGWVVRKACRSEYDHAALCDGAGNVIEASAPQGMRIRPVSEYAGCKMAANIETLTSKERAAIMAKARYFLTAKDEYSWGGVAIIGLRDLHIHWRILLRLLGAKHVLFCSQMVGICGVSAGLESWRCGKSSTAYVTPADLSRCPSVRVVQP